MSHFSWHERGRRVHLHRRNSRHIYVFKLIGKGRGLPASVDSQLPSAQNHPYAKVACFGVVYPDPLQVEVRDNVIPKAKFFSSLEVPGSTSMSVCIFGNFLYCCTV